MNYSKQIFDMLEIQPNEKFKLQYKDKNIGQCKYFLTKNLTLNILYKGEWVRCRREKIFEILNGTWKIIKIPKITSKDQIVIDYARLCGCKWLTKDRNKDGCILGFKDKPHNNGQFWVSNKGFIEILYPIFFLLGEGEEAYYIGD